MTWPLGLLFFLLVVIVGLLWDIRAELRKRSNTQ